MALFGRDYDDTYRRRDWSDRSRWGNTGAPMGRNRGDFYGTYGNQNTGWNTQGRYGEDYQSRYGSRYDTGYGRGYKSRWQTDYGDPFGDRQQHTPMRVIRGEARGYDQGNWNAYDRNFRGSNYPMGYRPYSSRAGYDTNFGSRSYRTSQPRQYDRGWF